MWRGEASEHGLRMKVKTKLAASKVTTSESSSFSRTPSLVGFVGVGVWLKLLLIVKKIDG